MCSPLDHESGGYFIIGRCPISANTAPIFPLTGIASAVAVTDVTSVSAGTGAATLVTAGSNGTKFNGIRFMPAANLTGGGLILIYYYNGSTNFLIGSVEIPNPWDIQSGHAPTPLYWSSPLANEVLKATYLIKVGKINQSGAIHALAMATDY